MSAPFRLLDDLSGGPTGLYYAWRLFGGIGNAEALERARHAVAMQVKEGLVLITREVNGTVEILANWEVRQVLADEANWHKQPPEAKYFLRLTEAGGDYLDKGN